jgi:hypothetical protein
MVCIVILQFSGLAAELNTESFYLPDWYLMYLIYYPLVQLSFKAFFPLLILEVEY